MPTAMRHALTKWIQRLFWIYLTDNFVITARNPVMAKEPAVKCAAVRITRANCDRVQDFRDDKSRIEEYGKKVDQNEIGLFAESEGRMVGSIWATVNRGTKPSVARGYMRLLPGEAMIHDIVTGERCRGMGIGAYMVERMAAAVSEEYGVTKIIVDVNFRNKASLRMMERAGARKVDQVFYVSGLGRLVLSKVLRQYPCERQ